MFGLRPALRARSVITARSLRPSQRLRPCHRRYSSEVQAQHVRFKSPGLTWRRLGTWIIYTTCIGGYLYWLSPISIEVQVVEDAPEQGQEEEQAEEEEEVDEWADRDSRFIPLTWAKKLPRSFYKGSDPEWEEFQTWSKDKERQKKIQDELIGMVANSIKQLPNLARTLGPEPKVGRYWLDIFFPDGPPQEYSRRGIEIGEDFIAISEQLLTEEEYNRAERLLWPQGTLDSLYSYYSTLWTFQRQKILAALGIESKAEPGTPAHRVNHLLQHLQAAEAAKEAKSKASSKGGADGASVDGASASVQPRMSSRESSPTAEAQKRWYMPSMKPNRPTEETLEQKIATSIFAMSMHKNAHHDPKKRIEPPRGCFVISGLIQLKGGHASVTFDVKAFYDPKQRKYTTVNVSARNVKRWRQQPRGGP